MGGGVGFGGGDVVVDVDGARFGGSVTGEVTVDFDVSNCPL